MPEQQIPQSLVGKAPISRADCIPDPGWQYSTAWELLCEMERDLQESLDFISKQESPTESANQQLKKMSGRFHELLDDFDTVLGDRPTE